MLNNVTKTGKEDSDAFVSLKFATLKLQSRKEILKTFCSLGS